MTPSAPSGARSPARVAIVTGGSRGIGRAVVSRLAADGYKRRRRLRRQHRASRAAAADREAGDAIAVGRPTSPTRPPSPALFDAAGADASAAWTSSSTRAGSAALDAVGRARPRTSSTRCTARTSRGTFVDRAAGRAAPARGRRADHLLELRDRARLPRLRRLRGQQGRRRGDDARARARAARPRRDGQHGRPRADRHARCSSTARTRGRSTGLAKQPRSSASARPRTSPSVVAFLASPEATGSTARSSAPTEGSSR